MKSFQSSQMLKQLPDQFFAKLVGKVARLSASGYDVINLGQGSPDQPTPRHVIDALKRAADNPLYHKYSPFQGHDFLKEAIAEFYKREYGVPIDPESEVAILYGGKSGLVEVSQCLLNPGDTALVPDPGYPDYWSGISMAKGRMSFMPLRESHVFLPDYDALSVKVLNQAKMMFLNYPGNPTGAVATPEFFAETVQIADRWNICVVHDFAYGAIGFDDKKPVSFLQTPGAKETGIEIYTLSKSYNMAGWRVGFALGNPSVIKSINLIQDHLFVSLFGAVQEAAKAALLGPQDCVRDLVQMYESRRNTLIGGLRNIGWEVDYPKGSFFTWFPVPSGFTSESFSDLLLSKAHIAVAPGIGFGKEGDSYVRAGLLAGEDRLLEMVERIKKLKLF
ncbi:aminotransferase [Scopulibacillus darangshiensis]|uniref:Aminotransferase n=1 Tax=Scopulibacillus darangshiensis TaxID=442528 RepID=A0A4R2P767_9BACL|nr:pyridoxal phosphate-dependent aminotransferase [Scopulibacillus darangshiensis]TCP30627.1 aminotransferase [Scopulibacillus darangshiensis]